MRYIAYICAKKHFRIISESVPITNQLANIHIIFDITKKQQEKMARRIKVIQLPRGKAAKMCNDLMIGTTTLYAALNYSSNSEGAKKTRRKALEEYGGVETTKLLL